MLQTIADIENQLFRQSLRDLAEHISYFRRLERVWHLIEQDYSDPFLKLDQAAKISGISKNHLNVLLRQTTGFTFHQLLTRYRLLQAATKMKTKNYSSFEIAVGSGFSGPAVFERNFRNLLGMTSKQFKRIGILG